MPKPIVYSKSSEDIRRVVTQILAVRFGKCTIVDHSLKSFEDEHTHVYTGMVDGSISVPFSVPFFGGMELYFTVKVDLEYDDTVRHWEITSNSFNYLHLCWSLFKVSACETYEVRYHSPGHIKIAQHQGHPPSWIVGSSADNRWSEPLHDGSDIGLCYYI